LEVNLTRTDLAPTYLTRRIKDHIVLNKDCCLKMLIFLYSFNFIFFDIFELLENICHMTRAVEHTLKENKSYFWYFWKWVSHSTGNRTNTKGEKKLLVFLKMSVTSADDRTDTIKQKRTFFIFRFFFYFFNIFLWFKIFYFLFFFRKL